MNDPLNININTYSIAIVACQRGGVSDEPPWHRAATRHGPGPGPFSSSTGGSKCIPIDRLLKI